MAHKSNNTINNGLAMKWTKKSFKISISMMMMMIVIFFTSRFIFHYLYHQRHSIHPPDAPHTLIFLFIIIVPPYQKWKKKKKKNQKIKRNSTTQLRFYDFYIPLMTSVNAVAMPDVVWYCGGIKKKRKKK